MHIYRIVNTYIYNERLQCIFNAAGVQDVGALPAAEARRDPEKHCMSAFNFPVVCLTVTSLFLYIQSLAHMYNRFTLLYIYIYIYIIDVQCV